MIIIQANFKPIISKLGKMRYDPSQNIISVSLYLTPLKRKGKKESNQAGAFKALNKGNTKGQAEEVSARNNMMSICENNLDVAW